MEPIIAVMLMLGCDDAMMVCRQSREEIRQYTSVEACRSDIELRVREVDNYPMAVADCIEVPETAPGTKISIDWRIDRTGGLIAGASIGPAGQQVAGADIEMASAERF